MVVNSLVTAELFRRGEHPLSVALFATTLICGEDCKGETEEA